MEIINHGNNLLSEILITFILINWKQQTIINFFFFHTPSALKTTSVAFVNFIFPDCIFVLIVSNGCEKKRLQHPKNNIKV